jgi:sulfite reductase (NADPH) flavoprotein alpha-component
MDDRLRLAEGKPLERVLMAAMAQLDCGACGYLCKTYSEAIAKGEEKSLTLCAPGGKATAAKLKEILKVSPPVVGPAVTAGERGAPTLEKGPAGTLYDRKNPFSARFVKSLRLNKEGSSKDTRLVVLDLEGSGIVYEPGDSLGVYPENCPDLVRAILAALGSGGNEEVAAPNGEVVTLEDALSRHFAINKPADELYSLLARSAANSSEADGLRRLVENGGESDQLPSLEVIDLLEEFPSARPEPAELVSCLSPLQPRLYSISSSLKAHPDEVHLTVGVVRYEARGRKRKGVASTFLAERVKQGQRVRIFVHSTAGFRLPMDEHTPLILIGPGTGIAPFRAFLEERKARRERGKTWLFFGDQRRELDFLYEEELEAYRKEGLLTRLDTAFSRDQGEKVYVQHRMLEKAQEIWGWLEEGANIYLCGDARRMARDVDLALRQIVAAEGRRSESAAKAYLDELSRGKRYQRDVY